MILLLQLEILDFSQEQIIKLAEAGIKTKEDLADLKVKEFNDILPDSGLSHEKIKELIALAKN